MGTFAESRGNYREAATRTWPDHRGRRVEGAVYWAPAPPSVGEVISAHSNQGTEGFRLTASPAQRAFGFLLITGLFSFFGAALTMFLFEKLLGPSSEGLRVPVGIAWVLALGALILWLMKPRPLCTYVGLAGVSEHKRGPMKESHLDLCFEEAESLTTEVTRRFTNGVYQGTDYRFIWRDAARAVLFQYLGSRREPGYSYGDREDPSWDFALASEAMWNRHRRPKMEAQMEEQGFVAFRVSEGRFLYVFEDKLELEGREGLTSLPREEIESIHVSAGQLVIREHGAKEGLLRDRGIHRLTIAFIDNYTLLLEALERWPELRLAARAARAAGAS